MIEGWKIAHSRDGHGTGLPVPRIFVPGTFPGSFERKFVNEDDFINIKVI